MGISDLASVHQTKAQCCKFNSIDHLDAALSIKNNSQTTREILHLFTKSCLVMIMKDYLFNNSGEVDIRQRLQMPISP